MASVRIKENLNGNLPPLEHGDRLSRVEFERRWEMMPSLKRAELLDGMVYLAAGYSGRILDRSIPPLENGDRLSRAEFERRWANMPDLKRAELLDGVVFMSPAVSADFHGVPHSRLMFWLGQYWAATPGVIVADNSTLRIPPNDDGQPDAMVLIEAARGGGAHFDQDGYVQGVPELVAEVSSSTASYDLNAKLKIYERCGVPEYVVYRTRDGAVSWFTLQNGKYEPMSPGSDGIFRSEVFPGLWLDQAALIRGDLGTIARVVQEGAATNDHAVFVSRLK